MKKLRHRDVHQLVPDHTASHCEPEFELGSGPTLHSDTAGIRDGGHKATWTQGQLVTRALVRYVWGQQCAASLGSPVLQKVC